MRVLHVLASSVGGGATHVFDLVTYKADEIEQRLVVPPDGGAVADRLRECGYRVEELDIAQGWKWKGFFSLVQYIREYQPDIVHCHGFRAGLYGRIAAKWVSQEVKTILTVHGFHLFYYKNRWKKKLLMSLERILRKWTDRVIAVSKTDWQHLLECRLVFKEKSKVILNGIQLTVENPSSREKARTILSISDPRQPIIATVCRLHHQKGVSYFMKAIPHVLKSYPNARFLIMGDGPERRELEQMARDLKNVHFLGNRNDVIELLPALDVCVSASLWEGLPLGLLEAMRAEVPIVATDVDGNRDVIEDGKSGLLVSPKDPEALAEAIVRLFQSPILARNLVKEAKIRLHTHFSLKDMVQKTQQIYREITGQVLAL